MGACKAGRLAIILASCADSKAAYWQYRQEVLPEKAEYLWRTAGCPQGRDLEFWCQAEREFDATFAYLLK